jgi:hypothetical protein
MSRSQPTWFRPQLEELEGRLVPNVSRLFQTLYVARTDGSVTMYGPTGVFTLIQGGTTGPRVTWFQAYLASDRSIAWNIVYDNTRWVVHDIYRGDHEQGTNPGGIRSVSTSYDPSGQEVIDVVQGDPRRGLGGPEGWFEYDEAGAHLMAGDFLNLDVISASTAMDDAGRRVSDYVLSVPSSHGPYEWFEVDPGGTFLKGLGAQSVAPSFFDQYQPGAVSYDVVHQGGEWDYYDAQGAHFKGTDVS